MAGGGGQEEPREDLTKGLRGASLAGDEGRAAVACLPGAFSCKLCPLWASAPGP